MKECPDRSFSLIHEAVTKFFGTNTDGKLRRHIDALRTLMAQSELDLWEALHRALVMSRRRSEPECERSLLIAAAVEINSACKKIAVDEPTRNGTTVVGSEDLSAARSR